MPNKNRFNNPTSRSRPLSILFLCILTLLTVQLLGAGQVAYAAGVDASIWEKLGHIQTLKARFTQTQIRSFLKTPLVSTGTVSFTRPSRLDWRVESPAKSIFLLDGSVATMEYPELGVSERIDLSQVPDANRLATSMMVWLQADASAVSRDFNVSYSGMSASLKPKDALLGSLLVEIQLSLASEPWRVASVQLLEPDGDRVEIAFSGVVLDGQPVPDP
jgi:outer membrane lipoprotein-sorting protein